MDTISKVLGNFCFSPTGACSTDTPEHKTAMVALAAAGVDTTQLVGSTACQTCGHNTEFLEGMGEPLYIIDVPNTVARETLYIEVYSAKLFLLQYNVPQCAGEATVFAIGNHLPECDCVW